MTQSVQNWTGLVPPQLSKCTFQKFTKVVQHRDLSSGDSQVSRIKKSLNPPSQPERR